MRRIAVLVPLGALALALAACTSRSVEGNGDVVTEIRTVSAFDAVTADNGVRVLLTIDPAASGDVRLAVTTDSNLQEFLTTEVSASHLSVSPDRNGGVTPTGGFQVSGAVSAIEDASVDNGAQIEIIGPSVDAITVSADNGAQLHGEGLQAATITVHADNGAQISVCATGMVSGEVKNGARLTVMCGANISGVETSDGGKVSSTP